jgi:asparagine synthetase B (glutamine-hydrolysing)
MPGVTMLGMPDSILGWGGHEAYLSEDVLAGTPPPDALHGAAAAVQTLANGSARVFRDTLGIGKLFWARDADRIRFAARPMQLVRAGHHFDEIMAVPRGLVAELDPQGRLVRETTATLPGGAGETGAASLAAIGARIRRELDAYLGAIASAYPARRVFVCLSGGLDSSTIAILARNHFSDVTAVSFDLAGPSRPRSEDRVAAERLAKDLGLRMIESTVSVDRLLAWLDVVLVEGIDWRDFNVHAGLVNAALANTIAEECGEDSGRPLVITGDLANEFLVDYKHEEYKGAVYYALPRVGPGRLRDILIHGIETCHREVGVFEAWDLTVVQPYSVAVEAYLGLPPSFLKEDSRKDLLVREIVGGELPDYIYDRPKARAQMGGTDAGGGVLGACIDRGIDAAFLRSRFANLHDVTEDEALDRFIRAGRYRAAVPAREEVLHG